MALSNQARGETSMNLLFRLVSASYASSTHHQLALDALLHLRGRQAVPWQRLFLKFYRDYLDGSKAPDKEFKDFRNHVLHVRDNHWGGAVAAAQQWYDKTVKALRRRRWRQATFSAGVLSHYYTDPIMPFHTAQSQAESNIHRAVEWSICKSYDELRDVFENEMPEPQLELSYAGDWLAQFVRAGAEKSTQHYETLIEHYDFRAGVKDPPAGLDDTCQNVLAELLGYAAVGFARILEKAFKDAGVKPPEVDLTVESVLGTIQIPIHWVTRKIRDARERNLIEAMYNELQEKGRVERYLPEDDRVVRDLHEKEVGRSVEPVRIHPSARPPAEAPDMSDVATREETTVGTETPMASIEQERIQEPSISRKDETQAWRRWYLDLDDDVVDAPSIGPKTARRLNRIGIRTVVDLLRADPDEASAELGVRYITPELLTSWQDQARLVCRIPGLRGHDAQILVACNWHDPEDIAEADAEEMLDVVSRFTKTADGERILRSSKPPDLDEVLDWIAWAAESRRLDAA